jgi:hypothetical protein
VPASLRVCALSQRTFMNNAGEQDAEKVRQHAKTVIWFVWSVSFVWFFG